MCTIVGFKFRISSEKKNYRNMSEVSYLLYSFLKSTLFVRGRDGVGISIVYIDQDDNNDINKKRFLTRYFNDKDIFDLGISKFVNALVNMVLFNSGVKPVYVLIHSRAIPENEVNVKSLQPVRYKDTIIVHNGTIYNDKEILSELYNKYKNKYEFIDSLAIAKYVNDNFSKIFSNKNNTDKIFNNIKGSYSVIGTHQNRYLFYIVNYQPLYKYQLNTNIIDLNIYTNIEPEVIDSEIKNETIKCVNEIEPYNFGVIS